MHQLCGSSDGTPRPGQRISDSLPADHDSRARADAGSIYIIIHLMKGGSQSLSAINFLGCAEFLK